MPWGATWGAPAPSATPTQSEAATGTLGVARSCCNTHTRTPTRRASALSGRRLQTAACGQIRPQLLLPVGFTGTAKPHACARPVAAAPLRHGAGWQHPCRLQSPAPSPAPHVRGEVSGLAPSEEQTLLLSQTLLPWKRSHLCVQLKTKRSGLVTEEEKGDPEQRAPRGPPKADEPQSQLRAGSPSQRDEFTLEPCPPPRMSTTTRRAKCVRGPGASAWLITCQSDWTPGAHHGGWGQARPQLLPTDMPAPGRLTLGRKHGTLGLTTLANGPSTTEDRELGSGRPALADTLPGPPRPSPHHHQGAAPSPACLPFLSWPPRASLSGGTLRPQPCPEHRSRHASKREPDPPARDGRGLLVWSLRAHPVARAGGTYELEHVPVEHVVVGEALAVEQVPEQLPQVRVVRLVVETQRTAEIQVRGKLGCGTRSSALTSEPRTGDQRAVCERRYSPSPATRVLRVRHRVSNTGHDADSQSTAQCRLQHLPPGQSHRAREKAEPWLPRAEATSHSSAS